jgi:hypothetical protein
MVLGPLGALRLAAVDPPALAKYYEFMKLHMHTKGSIWVSMSFYRGCGGGG